MGLGQLGRVMMGHASNVLNGVIFITACRPPLACAGTATGEVHLLHAKRLLAHVRGSMGKLAEASSKGGDGGGGGVGGLSPAAAEQHFVYTGACACV